MPQLDTTTFASQLFWLGVCFLALYLILAYIAVPKITRVLGMREEALEEKINKASLYREQAETLLAEYERALQEARQVAQQRYKTVMTETTLAMAHKQKTHLDKLHERLHLAEQALYRARREAGTEINAMAREVANAILYKLTGRVYASKEEER
jgi:F-type H+-transporting ATPase subunit b